MTQRKGRKSSGRKKKRQPRRTGERALYSERKIGGRTWNLAEKLYDSRQKELAKYEYHCEGEYVHCELIDGKYYEVWTRPGYTMVHRTLDGETVRRIKPEPVLEVHQGGLAPRMSTGDRRI